MQLSDQEWSIAASAREVRVSRTAGLNCARGHKTYKCGAVVGCLLALDPRELRVVSDRFLSHTGRAGHRQPAALQRVALSAAFGR